MKRRAHLVLALLGALSCLSAFADSAKVARRVLRFRCSTRVKAFTEEAKTITCPVSWIPITYLAENGAKVSKDEVVAEFDKGRVEHELGSMERERAVIEANLAHKLMQIENKEREMRDLVEGLRDKLAVLEAKLVRLKSLPLADDVLIVEGRLRIARLNFDAAEKDLAKAKDRFGRQMISRAELDSREREFLMQQASLDYAQQELACVDQPAPKGAVRKTELEIANVQLEIGKLEHELAEYKEISAIQKKGAMAQKKMIDKRISDKNKDLANTVVRAPIDGYVSYCSNPYDGPLAVGSKLWQNFTFMKIPDMTTLAFKGMLPEAVREHFKTGDDTVVRLHGRMDEPVRGKIKSISTLPHDLAEKDESDWGSSEREFGVKVFDVVISIEDDADWVRPGMHGTAELTAGRELSGPAVPIRFLKVKNGLNYLAVDGVFREATGTVNQGVFLLDDESWLGKAVTMRGRFEKESGAGGGSEKERRFSVSGELLPVETIDIIVKDVGRWPWPKVTWLVEEETRVKADDVVAKLDPTEINKRINRSENELSQRQSRVEELAKQKELTLREGEFKLGTETNKLAIAEIGMRGVLEDLDAGAVLKAILSRDQARVRLQDVTRRLERHESKKLEVLSPAELAKLRREKRRQELRLEEAEIRLARVMRGAAAVERSKAKLDYLKQEAKVDVMRKTIAFDNYRKELVADCLGAQCREQVRPGELQLFAAGLKDPSAKLREKFIGKVSRVGRKSPQKDELLKLLREADGREPNPKLKSYISRQVKALEK